MKKLLLPVIAVAVCSGCMTTPPNTLSDCEKADGWELLWDGKTSTGWVGVKSGCKTFPLKGWIMKDGVLTVLPQSRIVNGKWEKLPPEQANLGGGGDICTERDYQDFILKLDFKLTQAANSGIKYFYNPDINKGTTLEYQILHPAHIDAEKGVNGNRRVASLYDIIPSNADELLKPDDWNEAMIVSKGQHVEHWLNGKKVFEYERGSDSFRELVAKSKYANWSSQGCKWGELPRGKILLQDHNDSTVRFRNIKIKELK